MGASYFPVVDFGHFLMMTKKILAILLMGLALLATPMFPGRETQAQTGSTDTVVVLPFENVSNHPEYNWIGVSPD